MNFKILSLSFLSILVFLGFVFIARLFLIVAMFSFLQPVFLSAIPCFIFYLYLTFCLNCLSNPIIICGHDHDPYIYF